MTETCIACGGEMIAGYCHNKPCPRHGRTNDYLRDERLTPLKVGDEMIHHYETTSGWGLVTHVRVRVVKINPKTIRVERINPTRDGRTLQRNVHRKNVVASVEACRSGTCAEYDMTLSGGWSERRRDKTSTPANTQRRSSDD